MPGRRAARRRRAGRDPSRHLGRACDEVPGVPRDAVIDVRRHNANYCAQHFLRQCEDQVAKTIDEFAMIAPGERVLVAVSGGKDSLGLLGHPAAPRLRRRRLVHRARHRRVQRRVGRVRARVRRRREADALSRSTSSTNTASTSRAAPGHAKRVPCSACGLSKRHLFDKAALDGGYDVGRDRPQPRRRSRGAVRQRVALAHRLSRPAAAGASSARRLPAQGEAARAARRARDGGVLRARRHRLHRRGVPDGRGQQAPRVQGRAQRDRGAVARLEARRSTSASSTSVAPAFVAEAAVETGALGRACGVARRARGRSARSAGWSSERAGPGREGRR